MKQYTVVVEEGSDVVLRFEGYADNPTDALFKALEKRDQDLAEQERRKNNE